MLLRHIARCCGVYVMVVVSKVQSVAFIYFSWYESIFGPEQILLKKVILGSRINPTSCKHISFRDWFVVEEPFYGKTFVLLKVSFFSAVMANEVTKKRKIMNQC